MGLKEEIEAYEFDINIWGSVQYAGALRAYKVFMQKVEEKGLEDTVKEFEGLGPRVTLGNKDKDGTLEDLKRFLLADIEDFYKDRDMDDYDKEKCGRSTDAVKAMTRADDAFKVCREMAWDLWTAAAFIAGACGIKLEDVPSSRGVGPPLNVAAQGENLTTGLYCALLKATGLVEDEMAFADFDT